MMYNLQPAHSGFPRLFFTIDDLPDIRRKLDHPDCRATWGRLLSGCELMLTPTPPPVIPRHIRASHLAFAYLVTERPEFADKAIAMAMEIAKKPHWLMPGEAKLHRVRSGLATGGAVTELTLVYDWLYARLTADERILIREAVRAKGFEPTLQDIREGVPMASYYTTNGLTVLNGPLLMAALCFEGKMDTAEAYEASLRQLRRYLDAQDPDGGHSEGPLYWNYSVRHLLLGVESLRRLKGIDLYHEPFLHTTADYPLHYILPWMSDCTNTADALGSTHLWPPIAGLAAYHRTPRWQWLARRLMTRDWGDDGESLEYSLFSLIFYDPDVPDAPPSPAETTRLFSGIGQLAVRSDWTDDAIHAVWLNGPSNCHHNHLHLGSFTVSAFGRRLLIEMGKFNYSDGSDYRKQTAGHNTLLVGGEGQIITTDNSISCLRFRAGQWGTVYGDLWALRREADAVIGTGRAVNAYAGRLRTFERTLAFVDSRFFFLHDFIELERKPPADLEWHFHSAGDVEAMPDGAVLVNSPARLRMRFVGSAPLSHTVRAAPPELDRPGWPVPCLDVKATCVSRTFDLFAVLTPYRDGAEPAVSMKRRPHAMEFRVGEESWVYNSTSRMLRRLS